MVLTDSAEGPTGASLGWLGPFVLASSWERCVWLCVGKGNDGEGLGRRGVGGRPGYTIVVDSAGQ